VVVVHPSPVASNFYNSVHKISSIQMFQNTARGPENIGVLAVRVLQLQCVLMCVAFIVRAAVWCSDYLCCISALAVCVAVNVCVVVCCSWCVVCVCPLSVSPVLQTMCVFQCIAVIACCSVVQ